MQIATHGSDMSSEALYDIILTGKLEPGFSVAEVRFQLADLFKVEPEKIASVLANAPQVIRRGIQQQVAERYVDAIRRCGAQATLECKSPPAAATEPEKKAAEPSSTPAHDTTSEAATPHHPLETRTAQASTPSWSLAAPGADLLHETERKHSTPVQVTTEHLQLAPLAPLENPRTTPPPPPATDHLSVAEAGEDLLVMKPLVKRVHIGDLSHLETLPPGSDLLREEERQKVQVEAPDTSHLSLG